MEIKFSDRTGRKNRPPINPPESRLFSALVMLVSIVLAAVLLSIVILTFFPVFLLP